MASMARSNSTLSGCLEPTLASGFCTFLLVQATARAKRATTAEIVSKRRNITYLRLVAGSDFAAAPCPSQTRIQQLYTFCRVASIAAFSSVCALLLGLP